MNACISVRTTKALKATLDALLAIERRFGRKRSQHGSYENRILDLDIIYADHEITTQTALTLPHPRMHLRRFVLRPLADIAPQFYHPILNKDTRNLLQECPDKSRPKKLKTPLYKNPRYLFQSIGFLTIEGNIGSGKTTLTHKIATDFNAKPILERYEDNPFLPNFYEDQARFAFPLEMSFLADRYQQFMDDTNQPDLFKNFMVSDYDIFKSLIFARVTLPAQEFELYRKIFRFMYKEIKKPRLYVYLHQTPERLLENIKKRGRPYEQDIREDYLQRLNRGYLDYLKTYPREHKLVIDVSEIDFVARETDYNHILEQLYAHVSEYGL